MHHAWIPEMATVRTTLSANGVQPPFLSGHVLGGSQPGHGAACTPKNPRTHIPQLGRKPRSQDTTGDKKAMAVPERGQANSQWVANSQGAIRCRPNLTNMFACQLNLERKEQHEVFPPCLHQAPRGSRRAELGKNPYPLRLLPVSPGVCRFWSQAGILARRT